LAKEDSGEVRVWDLKNQTVETRKLERERDFAEERETHRRRKMEIER
jgi:hypothetical protein